MGLIRSLDDISRREKHFSKGYLLGDGAMIMVTFRTNAEVVKKDSPMKWKCRNCGFVYEESKAPEKYPVCEHAQSYLEVWC